MLLRDNTHFMWQNVDGSKKFILPMVGKGLWGPIWGYVAVNDDMSSIYGAVFDHKTETPGLGAEIKDGCVSKTIC